MVAAKITREQELWALALHVERKHGADGSRYIAERIGKFALDGDQGGVDFWNEVSRCFAMLIKPHAPSN